MDWKQLGKTFLDASDKCFKVKDFRKNNNEYIDVVKVIVDNVSHKAMDDNIPIEAVDAIMDLAKANILLSLKCSREKVDPEDASKLAGITDANGDCQCSSCKENRAVVSGMSRDEMQAAVESIIKKLSGIQ